LQTDVQENQLKLYFKPFDTSKIGGEENQINDDEDIQNQDEKPEQTLKLLKLKRRISNKDYDQALDIIEKELSEENISDFYYEGLINSKIEVLIHLDQIEDAINCHKKLIERDIDNYENNLKIAVLCKDIYHALEFIKNAQQINKYSHISYNTKISMLFYEIKNNYSSKKQDFTNEIKECIESSIRYFPTFHNRVYNLFLTCYKDVYEKKEAGKQLGAHFNKLKTQNPESLIYFKYCIEMVKNDMFDRAEFISSIDSVIHNDYKENILPYIILLSNYYLEEYKYNELEVLLTKYKGKYLKSPNFALVEAQLQLKHKNNLPKAISILEPFNNTKNNSNKVAINKLKTFYLYATKFPEALSIIENKDLKEKNDDLINYYENTCQFQNGLELVEQLLILSPNNIDYTRKKIYLLLHMEKFREAEDLSKSMLDSLNGWKVEEYYDVLLNFSYSRYKGQQLIDIPQLDEIISNSKDNLEKAVAYLLKKDKPNCYKYLDAELTTDKSSKYRFRNWKVFEEISQEERFLSYFK